MPGTAGASTHVLVCDIWPPYQVKGQDGLEGFSVEVVKAVYFRMGRETPDIVAFPWKRAVDMVKHQRALGIFSVNYTDDRAFFMRYPEEPLVVSPWVVWTRKGDRLESLDDLKGRKVGVVLGYSYTDEFWDFIEKHADVEQVHSDQVNFHKLHAGRLDAVIAEFGNGYHLKTTLGMDRIEPNRNIVVKKDGLYIAFSRDVVSQDFVNAFSRELKAFKKTQGFYQLRQKYFGE